MHDPQTRPENATENATENPTFEEFGQESKVVLNRIKDVFEDQEHDIKTTN